MKKALLKSTFIIVSSVFAVTTFGGCANLLDVKNPFKYVLLEDGTYEVSLNKKPYPFDFLNDRFLDNITEITIPEEYNGKPVTSIGKNGIRECYGLTSVIIPDTVTVIGKSAFERCSNLTNVVMPDSVTTIDANAFYACESLTSFIIPNSVITIGDLAFSDCDSLTSVVIPDSVTSIGNYAFCSCNSLTSVVIPDGVVIIGEGAFSFCMSLTSAVISHSVTSMGFAAFSDCENLTIYCKVESQPEDWDNDWNYSNSPVVWGYKEK